MIAEAFALTVWPLVIFGVCWMVPWTIFFLVMFRQPPRRPRTTQGGQPLSEPEGLADPVSRQRKAGEA